MSKCESSGNHERIVLDLFARDFGGRRVPGDCFCLDCGQPVPAYWNHGKPKEIGGDHASAVQYA